MFKITRTGDGARLESDAVLVPADFQRIGEQAGNAPFRARKIGFVAARTATAAEVVETRWNGKETVNTARPGDFIVTNLSPQRAPLRDRDGNLNVYVIAGTRFAELYEPVDGNIADGATYRARGTVSAVLLPGGFDIMAPWGQPQTTSAGYIISNGVEVYGSSRAEFEATYVRSD